MNDRKTILIVDDSPNEIRVLMENLKSDYAILTATNGEAALETANERRPDLILLDVNMAPMNGYDTCRNLQTTHQDIPVIFVSANTQTEEILKGFDVGGTDYITKPIDPAVLKTKVSVLFKQLEEQKKLDSEKNQASDLARAAMNSASDLDIIANFLRQVARTSNLEDLAQQTASTCQNFQLNASVQLRDFKGDTFNASTGKHISAVEADILDKSVNHPSRFLEKGRRLIVIYESVSLFVKNMPTPYDSRYTELKDYLLTLCQSVHEVNEKIKDDQSIAEQRIAMVLEAVKDAGDTLSSIQQFQEQYKKNNVRLMDELLEEIESNFSKMGLTEEQEQVISNIIQDKLNKGIDQMEAGLDMDDKLQRLLDNLNELTGSL